MKAEKSVIDRLYWLQCRPVNGPSLVDISAWPLCRAVEGSVMVGGFYYCNELDWRHWPVYNVHTLTPPSLFRSVVSHWPAWTVLLLLMMTSIVVGR